ncbi:ABC transporter ATP-binding protein [Pseudolysinimonas sp.]|uniref:ABC transporter ATP-binding protein n=1 Tax=Pseudolysinimonas sp. TaxID=2680009 RepID=UPI00286CD8B6|nr:ABC transporter ATP-binding protein [Pseudolysinimonas sp.]
MSDSRGGILRRGRKDSDAGPRASFRELLPYLFEHRGALVAVAFLSLASAAAGLAQPLLAGQVVGIVEAGGALGMLVWLLIGLVVVGAILGGIQHYLLQRIGTSVVFSARRTLVRRMLRLPISEFDRRRTGDLVSRVGSDTTLLYAVITQGLLDALGSAVLFVGALIGMLLVDPVLLGLTLTVIVVALASGILLSSRIRPASLEQQERVGAVAAAVERAIGAIRTVRAANATDRETAAIVVEAEAAKRAGYKVAKISAMVVPIAGIAMQVAFLVVIGVGGYRVASGAITIASLVTFILFLFMMIIPLGSVFGAVNSINQALGALGRIQEITNLPSETDADASIEPAAPVATAAAIRFDDVRFTYTVPLGAPAAETGEISQMGYLTQPIDPNGMSEAPGTPVPEIREVLKGVTFEVPRGSRVALVGPSGAGKSTVFALIERFYDPDSGVVRLDGRDVRGLPRDELRAQIGYVEQDAPVLAGNLRDNLTLAAPDATDAECIQVLRDVNLGAVLDRDPAGLDAAVGEDGIMLSGGERQRLAIARALLAAAPILLLDESTSSLDGMNEQLLREAIDAVAHDRTLLVIAHRLSTVVDSDIIVVLEHGEVVGIGTHSELVASTPLYRELAKHQLLV